jgi:protein O-GlcNAc transferase
LHDSVVCKKMSQSTETRLIDRLLASLRAKRFQAVVDEAFAAAPEIARDPRIAHITAASLAQLGRLHDARAVLSTHASDAAAEPPILLLASQIESDLGDHLAAFNSLLRLNERDPLNAAWWLKFAGAAIAARRPEAALRTADVHALLRAQNAEHALAYATLLVHAHRHDDALIEFERLLAFAPQHTLARSMYAEFVLKEFPRESHELLVANGVLQFGDTLSSATVRAMLSVPALYRSDEDAARWRANFMAAARELTERACLDTFDESARWTSLDLTPYFVAFHDADVTALQLAWGDFVESLIAPLRRGLAGANAPRRSVRRIGIVSNRLTDSSAGRFFNDWIALLRDAGFHINLYALGSKDAITDQLAAQYQLAHIATDDVSQLKTLGALISRDENDALLFPEPQGSPLTVAIAALKLAPIQCAAFGNPLTTGLPFMDYFFVPDAAEVECPAPFYRETVVRLAGVGASITRAGPPPDVSREQLSFLPHEKIYLVNQQLQKWTPSFVAAVLSILKSDRLGKLVYFDPGHPVSSRAFQRELRQRFTETGLDYAQRTQRIPMVDRSVFLAVNAAADVVLDTFGYAGGATTVDSLSVGVPLISLEGKWLRGRQSAGILRSLGLERFIVQSEAAFVEAALSIDVARGKLLREDSAKQWWGECARRAAALKQSEPMVRGVFRDVAAFFQTLR